MAPASTMAAHSTPGASSKVFPFFDLPRELRNKIYREMATDITQGQVALRNFVNPKLRLLNNQFKKEYEEEVTPLTVVVIDSDYTCGFTHTHNNAADAMRLASKISRAVVKVAAREAEHVGGIRELSCTPLDRQSIADGTQYYRPTLAMSTIDWSNTFRVFTRSSSSSVFGMMISPRLCILKSSAWETSSTRTPSHGEVAGTNRSTRRKSSHSYF
jgi:hypothetical protein